MRLKPLLQHFVLLLFFPGLRDLVILAIDAAEIAVAEEDVAGSLRAAQDGLFAEMRGIAGDDRQAAGVTGGDLVVEAIVAAELWADGAGAEQFFESFYAGLELILRQEC